MVGARWHNLATIKCFTSPLHDRPAAYTYARGEGSARDDAVEQEEPCVVGAIQSGIVEGAS